MQTANRDRKAHAASRSGHRLGRWCAAAVLTFAVSAVLAATGLRATFLVDHKYLFGPNAATPFLTDKIIIHWSDKNANRVKAVDWTAYLVALERNRKSEPKDFEFNADVSAEGSYSFTFDAFNPAYGVIGTGAASVNVTNGGTLPTSIVIPPVSYESAPTKLLRKYALCETLLRHNTMFGRGKTKTLRWKKTTIDVEGADLPGVKPALAAWEKALAGKLRFKPRKSIRSGIRFVTGGAVDASGAPGCGNAEDFEHFTLTTIHLSAEGFQNCPPRGAVLLHEIGHALGFIGHTNLANSTMGSRDQAWRNMTSVDPGTAAALRLLYTAPPRSELSRLGCKGF